MTQFLIGCDPEIFVRDENKKPVSAVGIVKGTKKEPEKCKDGAFQVDGLALELNTTPVDYNDYAGFNRNVISVLGQLQTRLPKGHSFLIAPSVTFDDEVIASAPPEALELGCEPDYNAWQDGAPNPRPNAATGLRTGAGHLHIGWDKDIPADHPDHIAVCCDFVKTLDLYVGLASIILDPDPTRRTLYGKAGAFRPKSYGVEYRTPSNAWLGSATARQFIFMTLNKAINAQLQNGKVSFNYDRYLSHCVGEQYRSKGKYCVERIINESDVETAYYVLQQFLGVSVPQQIYKNCMKKVAELGKMG